MSLISIEILREEGIEKMDIVASLVIYISTFTSSLYSFKCAIYNKEKYPKKIVKFILWSIIGILIPCLLAAFRDYSVGVDTENYAVNIVSLAAHTHNFQLVYLNNGGGTELLYVLLIYIVTFFTSEGALVLFLLQMLSIVPVFIAAVKLRNKMSVLLVMGTYFFMFYNNSLNLCKQSIACSFLLLAVSYLYVEDAEKYKKIKSLSCILLAIMFHKATLYGIAIIFICRWVSKTNKRIFLRMIIYVCIVLFPVILKYFINLMTALGILSERFVNYVNIFGVNGNSSEYNINPFSPYFMIEICLRVLLISVPLLLYRKSKNDRMIKFLRLTQILGLLMYIIILFEMRISYGQRISMFLDYFAILFIPYSAHNWRICSKVQKNILVYFLLFVYWFVWIVLLGWSGSGIYKFR